MNEDQLRDDVTRGVQAKALLENELLQETFEYLKRSYSEAWTRCSTPELREQCWSLCKAVDEIHAHLITVLNDGRLADAQIRELIQAEDRKRKVRAI